MVKWGLIHYKYDFERAKRVEDLVYMKILYMNLLIHGGWPKKPNKSAFKNPHSWHIAAMNSTCYFSQIAYLSHNIRTMSSFELGHSYITLFMTAVVTSRLILVFTEKYADIGNHFLYSLHLFNLKSKSPYAQETNLLVHKISHIFTVYLFSVMVVGAVLFNLIPLYTNYSLGMFGSNRPENSTFDHSVYHTMPFDYTTNFNGYLVVCIFNFYISYMGASSICTFDLFLSLMVFHVWGHLRILINSMDTFPRPAKKDGVESVKFSEEEMKDVFQRLKECVDHHNFAVNFASKMSDTFGEILLFYYAFHQVCGCFLLLECSQMSVKALLRYGTMSFVLFQQLIQISVIFELLASSGDRLAIAVYGLPWESMDIKNRRLVYFMLRRAQEPMNVKALDMLSVGVQTMITILKTSFSYFLMLRTFASTEET